MGSPKVTTAHYSKKNGYISPRSKSNSPELGRRTEWKLGSSGELKSSSSSEELPWIDLTKMSSSMCGACFVFNDKKCGVMHQEGRRKVVEWLKDPITYPLHEATFEVLDSKVSRDGCKVCILVRKDKKVSVLILLETNYELEGQKRFEDLKLGLCKTKHTVQLSYLPGDREQPAFGGKFKTLEYGFVV